MVDEASRRTEAGHSRPQDGLTPDTPSRVRPLAVGTSWFASSVAVGERLAEGSARGGIPDDLRARVRDGVAVASALAECLGALAPSADLPWERSVALDWSQLHDCARLPLKRLRAAVDALAEVGVVHYARRGQTATFGLAESIWAPHPVLAALDWSAARTHLDGHRTSVRAGLAVLRAVATQTEAHLHSGGPTTRADLPAATVSLAELSRQALYASTQVAEVLEALHGRFLHQTSANGVRRILRLLPAALARPVAGLESVSAAPMLAVSDAGPVRVAPTPTAHTQRSASPPGPSAPAAAAPPQRTPTPVASPVPSASSDTAAEPSGDAVRPLELRTSGRLRAVIDPDVVVRFRRAPDGRVVADIEGGWTLE